MARAATERPKQQLEFDTIALLLQGGGALGAYEAGVYQALAEAKVLPNWVAGISIGAVNAALIAGNPPEKRVARLREFWEAVSKLPFGLLSAPYSHLIDLKNPETQRLVKRTNAFFIAMFGVPSLFVPRFPPLEFLPSQQPEKLSFYDVAPLKATLERLVDFDRINSSDVRLTVCAVNLRTGKLTSFDTTTHKIDVRHIVASGSLPPGFPATEIDGEYYWDGGVASNSILHVVLDNPPRRATLAFQIDVWSASGELPSDMIDVDAREKDIRFSSRSRAAIDHFRTTQRARHALRKALEAMPDNLRKSAEIERLETEADGTLYNVVHLTYQAKSYEGLSKDYEFSRQTMEEHWRSGHEDASRAISHPEIFQRPDTIDGFGAFDFFGRHFSADKN